MTYKAGHKVGCGKETAKLISGRNVTNREKETHTKVKGRIWLEENIDIQSMVTLPLYSSLSKSSSHRQKGAKGTLVPWSLFQRGSGKWNLNKTKHSYVLRRVAWLGSSENCHRICSVMTLWPSSQVTWGDPFSHTYRHEVIANIQHSEPNTCVVKQIPPLNLTHQPLFPSSAFCSSSSFPPWGINVPTPVSQVPLAQLK